MRLSECVGEGMCVNEGVGLGMIEGKGVIGGIDRRRVGAKGDLKVEKGIFDRRAGE